MQKLAIASNFFTQEPPSELSSSNEMETAPLRLLVEDVPQELKEKLVEYSEDYAHWVRIAALRVMTSPMGWKLLSAPGFAPGADISGITGLLNLDEVIASLGANAAKTAVQAVLQKFESAPLASSINFPEKLRCNLKQIAKIVGLDGIEEAVLGLAILLHTEPAVIAIEDFLGLDVQMNAVPTIFATMLGISTLECKQAFSASSRLSSSGLLSLDNNNGTTCISLHLDLIIKSFAVRMLNGEPMSEVFGNMVRRTTPSLLLEEDYIHMKDDFELAVALLKTWSPESTTPLNILLWGPPGVGKTQLARLLAEKAGFQPNEIPELNEDGSPMPPSKRARAFRFSQSIFQKHPTVLILDECQEVLTQDQDPAQKLTKSWLNHLLETNGSPAIFICNEIDFDPSQIRRFDLCINLTTPPRPTRIRIIENACQGNLPQHVVNAIADHPHLSPAVMAKAGRIALNMVAECNTPMDFVKTTLRVINQHLVATGNNTIVVQADNGMSGGFDPGLARTNHDLVALKNGLFETRGARILAEGPPGTGKTAIGKWLADELGQPLMSMKGSDLLDKHVGGSEQKIRDAFANAQRDGAVLEISEIESFVFDRNKAQAQAQWLVTQVNEFLTALDTFEGIFIASTNHANALDEACQRRFDLRLTFDYLDSRMARELYGRVSAGLGLAAPSDADLQELDAIDRLTPGDFAQAHRRSRLIAIKTHADFVAQLKNCAAWKPVAARRIGF